MIKLTSISNLIRYKNNLSIIITIKFPLSYSMLPLLSQVLTIRERRRFESIPTQLGNLFLTQTQTYLHQGSLRSPLVQLRNQLCGSDQRRTLRDSTNPLGRLGLGPALGLMPLALRTSLLPPECRHCSCPWPELSY